MNKEKKTSLWFKVVFGVGCFPVFISVSVICALLERKTVIDIYKELLEGR